MGKFWSFKNVAEEERELVIDGVIADESWFDDDVTPKIFKDELNSGKGSITLWLNSPGGDCIAASQIYTMLKEYPHNVCIKIDGIAASAASVIAMAGDKVLMSPTSMLMIHNPQTIAAGDHNDMSKAIDVLEEVKESIINAYQLKTGKSRAKLSELMENETWMNANAAIRDGFADGMIGKDGTDDDEEEKDLEIGDDEPKESDSDEKSDKGDDKDKKSKEKPKSDDDKGNDEDEEQDEDSKKSENCVTFSQRQSNLKLVAKMADKRNSSLQKSKSHKISNKSSEKTYSQVDMFRARLEIYKKM